MRKTLQEKSAHAVTETEAQRFFNQANKHFPKQVELKDGEWNIEILTDGCELETKKRKTLVSSKFREPSIFRQTFGRHLISQKYSGFKTEYPIQYGIKSGEDKRPDFVVTFNEDDSEKILVFGEIGITTASDEESLKKDFYGKLKENIDRALLPEIINKSKDRLDENVIFWTPLYNGDIFYSDKANYDAYVDSPKDAGFYDIYEKTGIASWAISIPRKQLEMWNELYTNEIPLNELKAYPIDLEKAPSSLYLLNFTDVSVEANQISPYTHSNFSVHVNRSHGSFDLNRLPYRNNGRGGSYFDNIRGLSSDKVEELEIDILNGLIENLNADNFTFNAGVDDLNNTESKIVGFNNRSVKGSYKNSIVKMSHTEKTKSNGEKYIVSQILILSPDLSVDDSQHSGIALTNIISNIAGKNIKEISEYIVEKEYNKTLQPDELLVLRDYVESFNIIVDVSLWNDVNKGSRISRKSQYVENQSTVARELIEYKEKFKLIASAANNIDQSTHYEVIAAFGQDPKNKINDVESKGVEDCVPFVSGYYRFKDALEKMAFVTENKELKLKHTQLDNSVKWTQDLGAVTLARAMIKHGTEARKKKQNYDYLYKQYTEVYNQKQVEALTNAIENISKKNGLIRDQKSVWKKVLNKYIKLKATSNEITELYADLDREIMGKRNKSIEDSLKDHKLGEIIKEASNPLTTSWCSENMKYILEVTSHLEAEEFVKDSKMDTFIKKYHKNLPPFENKINAIPIGVYGAFLAFVDYYNDTSIFTEEESYITDIMDKLNDNLHNNDLDIESLKRDLVRSKIEKSFVDSLFKIFDNIIDFDKLLIDKKDDFDRLEEAVSKSISKDMKKIQNKKSVVSAKVGNILTKTTA